MRIRTYKQTDTIETQTVFAKAVVPFELIETKHRFGRIEVRGNSFTDTTLDPLFEEAARLTVEVQKGSVILLQRKLRLGYNRAKTIIGQLETSGIVGPYNATTKSRPTLIRDKKGLDQLLGFTKRKIM